MIEHVHEVIERKGNMYICIYVDLPLWHLTLAPRSSSNQ